MSLFRRRPLFNAIVIAAVCWLVSGWWWGPVGTSALVLGPGESCNVLGFAEDGSLISVERAPHTASWSVWKRSFPDCGREELWRTSGVRKEAPDDIAFRIQPGGRWLFVAKLGTQPGEDDDSILDLRTGKVYPGRDDGMRWVTPDGRLLLTADNLAGIRVTELATGRKIGQIDDAWINALSADGRWVAAETTGTVRVWKLNQESVNVTAISTLVAEAPPVRLERMSLTCSVVT